MIKLFKLKNNLFHLANTKTMSEKYPETFERLDSNYIIEYINKSILKQGFVHIKCSFNHNNSIHSERMWVIVKEFNLENKIHVGILDNDPITEEQAKTLEVIHGTNFTYCFSNYLHAGDLIEFKLDNVCLLM